MAEFEHVGWFKTHRSMFDHPIFSARRMPAFIVFQWMLAAAAPWSRVDRSFARPFEVQRGQLVTSIDEIATRTKVLTPKQVRSALAWMEKEGMIMREDRRSAGCSLITIVNYERYQAQECRGESPGEEGGERGENPPSKKGHTGGHSEGHTGKPEKGKPRERRKPLSRNGKQDVEDDAGANLREEKGQTGGQTKGQASLYKDQEVKELINPPNPPLKKGGRSASNISGLLGGDEQRYRMVLDMWREERAAAGLNFQEDRNTAQGARILAADYLNMAQLTVHQLREGMRDVIRRIGSDAKCRNYDLRTLANNPSKFCPPPPIAKPKRVKVRWIMVCDVCGHELWTDCKPAGTEPPRPEDCPRSFRNHCQGTLRVEREEARES